MCTVGHASVFREGEGWNDAPGQVFALQLWNRDMHYTEEGCNNHHMATNGMENSVHNRPFVHLFIRSLLLFLLLLSALFAQYQNYIQIAFATKAS